MNLKILGLTFIFTLVGCGEEAVVIDESWKPNSEVKIMNPWAVGGSADIAMRLVAKHMEESVDQNIVITNRVGAAGVIATTEFLNTSPDEHSMLLAGIGLYTFTPLVNKDIKFTIDDFKPVAEIKKDPFVVLVNPNTTGIRSIEDLVEYSKSNKVIYASNPPGGSSYLLETALMKALEIDAVNLTGNTTQNITAILGDHATVAAAPPSLATSYVKEGTLYPIGVFSEKDFNGYEGITVPSIKKNYNHDIVFEARNFLVMDKSASDHAVNYFNKLINQVSESEAFKAEAKKMGYTLTPGTPEMLLKNVKASKASVTKLVNYIK